MAAYPSFGVTENSRQEISDGRQVVRATNGALKVRRLYASDKSSFSLEHELTSSQVSTLRTFYTTNADLGVDFTWAGDGTTYTVRFAAAPVYTLMPGGWYTVNVKLAQV